MQIQHSTVLQVMWEGPFPLTDLSFIMNEETDYGVYQIYGSHKVYGSGVLLYIGKADYQTIGKRISQEDWWNTNDYNNLQIYAGRLIGETPAEEQWSYEIDLVEKLLIYVHKPAYNSKNLVSIPEQLLKDVHVLNWGAHRSLLPEVSGRRWTKSKEGIMEAYYQLK